MLKEANSQLRKAFLDQYAKDLILAKGYAFLFVNL